MKRIIYTAIFLSASWLTGLPRRRNICCSTTLPAYRWTKRMKSAPSFYYTDASINRDTVYLTVNTIGDPEDRVRHIAMEQISEYDVEYKYDEKGNLIDSVLTEKPNKAVPGVHYVPMDDPEMLPLLVIQPNAVTAEIPVIRFGTPPCKRRIPLVPPVESYRRLPAGRKHGTVRDDYLLGQTQ